MTREEALHKNVTVKHLEKTEEERQQIIDDLSRIVAKIILKRMREDKTAQAVNQRRKIDNINKDLTESRIALSKYWVGSQYKDGSGKLNREFQLTKRGCEFLAHKSTGTKGNLFTDRYMDRFAEMEQEISKPRRLSALEQLNLHNQAIIEVDEKVEAVKTDLEEFKQDLPLLGCDMDRITTAVKKMGVKCLGGKEASAYKDKPLRSKVYMDIYDQLKREFGVSTYKSIKRSQCDTAVQIINGYQLPMVLEEKIKDFNAQEVFVQEGGNPLKKYYFTFDGSAGQPYKRGDYLIVFADNASYAISRFNDKYPPINGTFIASIIYTPEDWIEVGKGYPFQPVEVINRPETKDILRDLAEQLVDDCKAYALDNISLQVKPNGQVLAVAEYKEEDGKQTFTRVSRRDKTKPFIIL